MYSGVKVIEYVAILTAPPLTIFNHNNSLVVHLIKLYDLDPMDGTCNVGLRFLQLCDVWYRLEL